MAVTHGIQKYYSSFRGLNEILDDVVRDPGFATEATNVRILEDGSLAKRRGYKIFAKDAGGYGVLGFNRVDPESGEVSTEVLLLSDTIHRLLSTTLIVTNSNANGQDVTISVKGDSTSGSATSGWGSAPWGAFGWGDAAGRGFVLTLDVAQLIDDNGDEVVAAEEVTFYLGDEIENTGLTIEALNTGLNSSPHLTSSYTTQGTTPSPFLELLNGITLASGESVELTYYYTSEVTKDAGAGLPLGFANFKTSDTASLLSHTQFNRSLFLTNGLDELQQYDGQALFRAGMTAGTTPTPTSGGAGVLTGDYKYRVQPWFRDRNGVQHFGAVSNPSATLTLSTQQGSVPITNIQAGNGFDARGAFAAGTQSNAPVGGLVTLTVDDGAGGAHTVVAGDKIRVFNRAVATNAYAEYVVSSVTNTTIVVQSSVDIDLTDNDIISTGIFLDVYRTEAGGNEYYLVETLNNDPFNATQTYTDNLADSSLGARFIEPIRTPSLPPKCKYVTTFNNSLVLANKPTDPNAVYYSEPDEPSNFPELNFFLTESGGGGVITAITQTNETLVIFRESSVSLMLGDFARDRINVTNLSSGGVGCVSHSSIVDINGVTFFLGNRGIYTMAGAGLPQLISNPVIKTLTGARKASADRLRFERAVGVHNEKDKQLLMFIPAEESSGGNRYSNASSLLLVYDYVKDNWTVWDNVHFSCGATYVNRQLWFSSRELRLADEAVTNRLWRQHDYDELLDYGDQLDPISFLYASSWDSVGSPSIAKKFLRLKVHSYTDIDDTLPLSAFTVSATTEIDYQENTPHSSFTFTFPDRASTWDSRPWDDFTWGEATRPAYKTKLRKGQARSIRLKLENDEYETNVAFTGWELEYAAPQGNTIKQ